MSDLDLNPLRSALRELSNSIRNVDRNISSMNDNMCRGMDNINSTLEYKINVNIKELLESTSQGFEDVTKNLDMMDRHITDGLERVKTEIKDGNATSGTLDIIKLITEIKGLSNTVQEHSTLLLTELENYNQRKTELLSELAKQIEHLNQTHEGEIATLGQEAINLLQNEYQKNINERTDNLNERYMIDTYDIHQKQITDNRCGQLSKNAEDSITAIKKFVSTLNTFVNSIENNLNNYDKFKPGEVYSIPFWGVKIQCDNNSPQYIAIGPSKMNPSQTDTLELEDDFKDCAARLNGSVEKIIEDNSSYAAIDDNSLIEIKDNINKTVTDKYDMVNFSDEVDHFINQIKDVMIDIQE